MKLYLFEGTPVMLAIPNFITCLNLLCGCLGIVFAFNDHLIWSAYMVGIAGVADFLDGFVARLLKAQSSFGKELDSLADLVSFGILPGVILFQFISIGFGEYFTPLEDRPLAHLLAELCGFAVTIASALRLAKFNIDDRQTDGFLGLPTPANTIFIASFPLILGLQFKLNFYVPPVGETWVALQEMFYWDAFDEVVLHTLFNPWFHVTLAFVSAVMLVVPLPLFALKFKRFGWRTNRIRYTFLGLAFLVIGLAVSWYLFYVPWPKIDFVVIPIIVVLYILLSIIHNFTKRNEVPS